ncbi:oxidoreductase domain protein [Sulfobacillus acidophilus DSM 10332]|uniref:Oxidoreductase domain protein n=1 Tax=Sulfobacillus acidophilus (strain ATCC 700253 / DSM 10332 / NAL) TaxID=679936 RepID=G8TTQ7_SULAD|nr:oxidoreductase domain protein [Sulfobacillus acidophilus DSM 10332]
MRPKLALVGCGKIGQKHLQALVHSNIAELVATVDVDIERARAAAVPFDARSYPSLESLLALEPIDAVIIATPSGTHRALTEMALRRGLHVMVEKPLALTGQDATAMVELARQKGRVLTVTQFNRLLPAVSHAIHAYKDGRLGRILEGGVSVRWARPQAYYDQAPWRGTRAMDGGVLFNQAIHALDVLLQFVDPVVEVFAYAATLTHKIEAEDTVAGVMRTRSGALLTVNATTSVAETNLEERVVVVGETGALAIGPTPQQLEFWRVPGDDEALTRQTLAERPARPGWQSHLEALSDFVNAIVEGLPSQLTGASAIPVIRVIEALIQSAMNHRPVSLEEGQAANGV